ncbi:MAG: glycosyltransferase family 2 protein [Candidatus Desulfofervidus auxilii]|nr:glycosyltransferase family 2 protein [Candidatus Desulfofervidus auxilii]
MKVSIIVTTYNRPLALKRVLEGLIFQTHLPDEVIIADDGSGKETEEVIKNFIKKSPFKVLHVWQEDKGFRAAKIRNKAIKLATSEYIIFLDGDCIPNKYFISDHLFLAEKNCFVQGKRVLVSKDLEPKFSFFEANSFSFLIWAGLKRKISNTHHIFRFKKFPAFKHRKIKGIKGCNMAFFKKDLLAVNGFNEDFEGWGREDTELAIRCYKYGLYRKEHPFLAICFHLWHPPYSRDGLSKNDALLAKTLTSNGYFCKNGIVKGENDEETISKCDYF